MGKTARGGTMWQYSGVAVPRGMACHWLIREKGGNGKSRHTPNTVIALLLPPLFPSPHTHLRRQAHVAKVLHDEHSGRVRAAPDRQDHPCRREDGEIVSPPFAPVRRLAGPLGMQVRGGEGRDGPLQLITSTPSPTNSLVITLSHSHSPVTSPCTGKQTPRSAMRPPSSSRSVTHQ